VNSKGLGISDFIVINGGSNDIDKPSRHINVVLSKLIRFVTKYNNTNILMVTMPFRHDLAPSSKTNVDIQAFNSKLKKITKAFKHVSVIDMSSDRSHFTRHGLHMNSFGKERFAKQVASQIEILTKPSNNPKPAVPLEWKEMVTTLHMTPSGNTESNMMTTVNVTAESLTPPPPTQNVTSNTSSHSHPRTSTRNKKAPITLNGDFLL
jgi:hypothetical protein